MIDDTEYRFSLKEWREERQKRKSERKRNRIRLKDYAYNRAVAKALQEYFSLKED